MFIKEKIEITIDELQVNDLREDHGNYSFEYEIQREGFVDYEDRREKLPGKVEVGRYDSDYEGHSGEEQKKILERGEAVSIVLQKIS
jgi:hypothetical protein